jgi:predicted nucleotide-binding protein
MAISRDEYEYRVSELTNLDFQDATARLLGFVEWLETDPKASSILTDLRERSNVEALIKGANPHTAPKASTPREVAAVALCMIDNCKHQNTELFQVGAAIGFIHSHIQETQDEISRRYLLPFFRYVEIELFAGVPATAEREKTEVSQMNFTDVFIVHGREEASKQAVARFVEKVGLNAIILHEQSNRGRTVIEKFEHHADVQFAINILTPDDIGRLVTETEENATLRARQNVIFEMGYFIGRIGRDRVFPLKKGDLDIPSDYSGVVYTDFDEMGAWKMQLVRELKSAGFTVDANHAFD